MCVCMGVFGFIYHFFSSCFRGIGSEWRNFEKEQLPIIHEEN